MNKIQAVTIWWYSHIPKRTEVNFHRQNNLCQYQNVTPSSRERLGNVLFSLKPHVGIGASYTNIHYSVSDEFYYKDRDHEDCLDQQETLNDARNSGNP